MSTYSVLSMIKYKYVCVCVIMCIHVCVCILRVIFIWNHRRFALSQERSEWTNKNGKTAWHQQHAVTSSFTIYQDSHPHIKMNVWWDRKSYHDHVSSERVGQICYGGVTISIRGLALGAVSWLVAPVSKNTVWARGKTARTCAEKLTHLQKERMSEHTGSPTSTCLAWKLPIWNNQLSPSCLRIDVISK